MPTLTESFESTIRFNLVGDKFVYERCLCSKSSGTACGDGLGGNCLSELGCDGWMKDTKSFSSDVTNIDERCQTCPFLQTMIEDTMIYFRCGLGGHFGHCLYTEDEISKRIATITSNVLVPSQSIMCTNARRRRPRSNLSSCSRVCLSSFDSEEKTHAPCVGPKSENCPLVKKVAEKKDELIIPEIDKGSEEYLKETTLLNYDVRQKYGHMFKQLDKVRLIRESVYGGLGFSQGDIFYSEPNESNSYVGNAGAFLSALEEFSYYDVRSLLSEHGMRILTDNLSCLAPKEFRLNFHPGAIISGAQRRDTSIKTGDAEACACFGYDCSYEATALQMAFDPHIAILEPLKPSGERSNGFQMVVLGTLGIYAYGEYYDGSDHNEGEATAIVASMVHQSQGWGSPSLNKWEIPLRKLDELEGEGGKACRHLPQLLERLPQTYEPKPEGDFYAMDEEWEVIGDEDNMGIEDEDGEGDYFIPKAYRETLYAGESFRTGVTHIERPYDATDIRALIESTGVYERPWRVCGLCGKEMTELDKLSGNFFGGENYGLTGIYDTQQCLGDDMIAHSTDTSEDKTQVVIGGKLYTLPEFEEE